jgi:NADPH-dependent curcumin reductase CurA
VVAGGQVPSAGTTGVCSAGVVGMTGLTGLTGLLGVGTPVMVCTSEEVYVVNKCVVDSEVL